MKSKILDHMGKIYEESENCKLEESFLTKLEDNLSYLSEYFHASKSQSLLISLVFALSYRGKSVNFNDLVKHFDCNPIKLLEYNDDFQILCDTKIFIKENSKIRIKLPGANYQYTINEKISDAILKNQPMPEIAEEKLKDCIDL